MTRWLRRAAGALTLTAVLASGCSSSSGTSPATFAATPKAPAPSATGSAAAATTAAGAKDASYLIEGRTVTLVNGTADEPAAPGSASRIVTKYLGNEASGDLDGDGQADTAFILTQSPGGSGTFYYVVVALRTKAGITGTNGVLLGDRIVPKSLEVRGTEVIVTYADRKPGEPMSTQPSVEVTRRLKVAGGKLVPQ